MAVTNLTTSTVPSTGTELGRSVPAPGPVSFAVAKVAEGTFNTLRWQYRVGCDSIVRQVPADAWRQPAQQGWQRVKHNARREVWRAQFENEAYYLKYYFQPKGLRAFGALFRDRACRREWEGGLYVLQAGVAALEPVAYTTDLRRDGRLCDLLITAAVEPAQPLDEFWQLLSSDSDVERRRADKTQLIEILARLIARAHQAGFEHLDMHVANILIQPTGPRRYRAVFVDLQSARRGVPIAAHAVVRNLAQLNQWFRRHSTIGDRLRFLRAYMRWRNEYETACEHGRPLGLTFEQLVAALVHTAHRHAERIGSQRDRRLLRDGRYFTRLKLADGWRGMAITRCKHAADESRASQLEFEPAWWQKQLTNPLRWFAAGSNPACKDSHSAAVSRVTFDLAGESVQAIVKRPRARNGWRRLVQLLPPSRSLRGWCRGHALLHRDLPTARPLAALERKRGPFVLDSLLLTEALPGALDLETFLHEKYSTRPMRAWARLKRQVLPLLVRHVRRLHERGFDHRDCKASNILVVQHPELKLVWIDMDGLRLAGRASQRRQLRPLTRLHVSLLDVPGLTRTDRVRFLKAYCARFGVRTDAWRDLWHALDKTSAKKLRAQAARRQWKQKRYGRT